MKSAKELMTEACKNVGCSRDMLCFGGKEKSLCDEAVSECTKIRTKEIEDEAWQLLKAKEIL